MSLRSLHQLLGNLQNQPPTIQQFQRLLQIWAEVVGSSVAAHARPVSMERGVLYVATASSAWAQDLVFKRRRLLQGLNAQLSGSGSGSEFEPLLDIRFSTAQWQDVPVDRPAPGSEQQAKAWAEHPSHLTVDETAAQSGSEVNSENSPQPLAETPIAAFDHWATQVRSLRQMLPLCPECQSPTPTGELQRWQVCGVCASKQWQQQGLPGASKSIETNP